MGFRVVDNVFPASFSGQKKEVVDASRKGTTYIELPCWVWCLWFRVVDNIVPASFSGQKKQVSDWNHAEIRDRTKHVKVQGYLAHKKTPPRRTLQ